MARRFGSGQTGPFYYCMNTMKKILLYLFLISLLGACQSITPYSAPQEKVVRINDIDVPYIEQGNGIPVVFVHGSMSDYRIWDQQRLAVAAHYRFIAYTQRYFGSKEWHDNGAKFSQATHAADLIAFIEALHAGPVHVVAWSYGGSVATLAATQRPDLFRSLSIHEPTIGSLIVGTKDGKAAATAFAKSIAGIHAVSDRGEVLSATKLFWEFIGRLPAGGFDHEAPALQHIVLDNSRTVPLSLNAPPQVINCDMLKKITAPVLITVGDNTRPLWSLAGAAMRDCVPNGRLVGIADSNHDAIFRQPAAFNAALLGFLNRVDSSLP